MSCQIDYIKYTQCVTCYHHDNIWHMHIVDTHTHTYVCTYICMYMHCVGRYQTLDDPPKHLNRLSPIWEKSTNAIMVLVTSKIYKIRLNKNISTTLHDTTKLFVPFCSAQDGESADMNCLVFWAHCKNGKILMKRQVYNKGIFTNFG